MEPTAGPIDHCPIPRSCRRSIGQGPPWAPTKGLITSRTQRCWLAKIPSLQVTYRRLRGSARTCGAAEPHDLILSVCQVHSIPVKEKAFSLSPRRLEPFLEYFAIMPDQVFDDISHRRYNPLTDSWLLVSPHRTKRPWQ